MTNVVLQSYELAIGYGLARRERRVVGQGLNLTLKGGELVCLIGPNGAGKSTLMRTLAGMQPALGGRVLLLGDEVGGLKANELARRLSVVLTERIDVGMLSAFELVALGRYPYTEWSGALSAHDEDVIQWALKAVGAGQLADRSVGELSDGERQKVLIARALAQEPALMLLDEPTAFLDLPRRVEIMRTLRDLARSTGRAILLSTHDLDLALRSADRIWLMPLGGQLQAGAPEDLVLSGAFEAAFRGEGIEFDAATGSFRVSRRTGGQVLLTGEGLEAVWTARALERAGFEVVQGIKADTLPYIEALDGRWRVTFNGAVGEYAALYDVVAALSVFEGEIDYER